jgi:hypothetical protein
LVGGRDEEQQVEIGSLIARQDVEVTLSAPKMVSRHMAILAMTGGGKTVAARRIIRELIGYRYPMLILDPHGDYIGLWKCRHLFPTADIRLFFPQFTIAEDGQGIVVELIQQMTAGLTDPQSDYIGSALSAADCRPGEPVLDYIRRVLARVEQDLQARNAQGRAGGSLPGASTIGAVRRGLRIVEARLARMTDTNQRMRDRFTDLDFEPLPDPISRPERIIRPGQVSIVYLDGYDHITQCSIAAVTLDALFNHRADLSNRIPPFQVVIEEAHTFIPSAREGTSDAVSLTTVRRVITEGRKFGTGLILISQRPSRLDETIVSQCNSFLILRLVNPRDQSFVRSVMENLTESDARMIPGFGPGQGIVSGQVVRFPLPVMVRMDRELLASELGDENFFEQVGRWRPDPSTSKRERNEAAIATVEKIAARRSARGGKPISGAAGPVRRRARNRRTG